MEQNRLSSEVLLALEQLCHERRIIEAFAEDPTNENVGSVTLEVSGVEHVILVHDWDAKELANLLLRFNKKEHARMTGGKSRFGLRKFLSKAALW